MHNYLYGVSICIFTYNFEKYISEAIESVITQKTNFPIEIIIGDDCSTDDTQKIIEKYYAQYPNIIELNLSPINRGGTHNWITTIKKAQGKYIALLDGDDFFSDPYKLQTQYDWLESHPEYSFCFHSVTEFYDDRIKDERVVISDKEIYTIADFLERGWFVRTGSTFFRNGLLPSNLPAWVYDFPYRFDTILQVMVTQHGDAYNIKKPLSKWRRHGKGLSFEITKDAVRNELQCIELSKRLDQYTDFKYHKYCRRYQKRVHASLALGLLRRFHVFNNQLVKSIYKAGLKDLCRVFINDYVKKKLNP
jgi:glycosyltransferase involved in cell wall biosynthesis